VLPLSLLSLPADCTEERDKKSLKLNLFYEDAQAEAFKKSLGTASIATDLPSSNNGKHKKNG